MIRGAIFDVDGTLLDSMQIWDTAADDYLLSIGATPEPDLRETVRSMSSPETAVYLREHYGLDRSVETIRTEVNRMIETFYRETAQPKPGLPAFLEALAARDVRCCIATATDDFLIEAALHRCGLWKFFSGLLTCTGVGAGKTSPTIFREALKVTGTDRSNTVVFEDALFAARTVKADGFLLAAVEDSHEEGQDELKALADVYLRDYSNTEEFWKFAASL